MYRRRMKQCARHKIEPITTKYGDSMSLSFAHVVRCFPFSCLFALPFSMPVLVHAQRPAPRIITADVTQQIGPVDRFFDLSVGSDYPGTLIRPDSQAQLKIVAEELGFRYLRFHAIFHDVLG